MFLDGGRKPEYPERPHAYTGRTCKLHTERPQVGATVKPKLHQNPQWWVSHGIHNKVVLDLLDPFQAHCKYCMQVVAVMGVCE